MKLVIAALLFGATAWAAGDTRPIFRLFTSEAALQGLLPAPTTRKTKVDEQLAEKVLKGMAFTSGQSRLDLLPSDDGAKLRIIIDLTTSTRTTTESKPRTDITVSVFTTAITRTTATKIITLLPDHIESSPTETSSTTAITLHGVSARATGSFSGEKQRQAEAQATTVARNSIPGKEAETSQRLQKEIAERVDGQAAPLIESLNRDYKQIFYVPLFTDGRVPGSLRYYSTEEGFRIAIDAPADRNWEPVGPLPILDDKAVFGANVHQSLLNGKMDRLAGKVYDETELEGFFKREGLKIELHDWGTIDRHIYVRFCDARPIGVVFANDGIDVSLCAKAVKKDGTWLGGANLAMHYELTKPRVGAIVLKRSAITATAAPGSNFTGLDRFAERYGQLFPAEITMSELPFPSMSDAMKETILDKADITDGWFNLQWKAKESK